MSDLSRLLGDVYGSGPVQDRAVDTVTDEAPAETSPLAELPAWSDDAVLDEAFADWVPGPPSSAPAAERNALTELAAAPEPEAEADEAPDLEADAELDLPVAESLAEALPVEAEWFFDVPADDEPEPVVAEPVLRLDDDEALVPWQRTDDDLLPAKGRRRKRR